METERTDEEHMNVYGSEIFEAEPSVNVDPSEERGEEQRECPTDNRVTCKCKSACKTKQKNTGGRGCPCRTANIGCTDQCSCGTARTRCANKNVETVRQGTLPGSSLERQRRDIQETREEVLEFVTNLSEDQRKEILLSLLNNGRGSLDFARRLLRDDPEDPDEPAPSNQPHSCICRNCVPMPTPEENKCCMRRVCITSYELFLNLCLDRHVLEMAIRSRCDAFVEQLDFSAASFRKASYRQFVLWEHGYLGRGNRRVIPSCAVCKIRSMYPAPDNVYMGFRSE